jgi:hypothetical protein
MFQSLQRAWLLSRRPPLDDVIREVVRRSTNDVRRRMSESADNMSDAELRGYVRARAARPVRFAAEELATEQGWLAVLSDSIVAGALERMVHHVVYQTRMQPVAATSVVRATLRVAA